MPCPPERPANPRICHGASYIRVAPGAPPACSRAPALPIPSAPDRPDTSADTLLKVAPSALSFELTIGLTTLWTTAVTTAWSSALTSALPPASTPAPAAAPLLSRPAPESLPNTASAFFSLPDPPRVPNFGGYPRNLSRSPTVPILCQFRQA